MKRLLCTGLVFFSAILSGESLTLSQAVSQALEASPELQAARHRIMELDYEVKAARTRYLPRIQVKGSYTRLDDSIDIQLDSLRQLIIGLETGDQLSGLNLQSILLSGRALSPQEKAAAGSAISAKLDQSIPSFDIQVLDRDLFRSSLEAAQPVWMGGKIKAFNRSTVLNRQDGEIACAELRNQVAAETVRLYLQVKLMEESLRLSEEVLSGIAAHRDRAASLFEAGLVARYQLQHAQVAFSNARVLHNRTREGLACAKAQLGQFIGRDIDPGDSLCTPIRNAPGDLEESALWQQLRHANPALQKVALKKEMIRVKKRADLAEYLPQIFAFARYELLKNDLSLLDPNWTAGFSLSLNLFSGGEKVFRHKADQEMALRVEDKEMELEQKLKMALNKLIHASRAETVVIDGFDLRLNEAEENLRLAEIRFSSGLGISLEVVDARLMLQHIQLERLQSIFRRNMVQLKVNELAQNVDNFVRSLEE